MPRRSTPLRSRTGGFTLLELLLATAIGAVVLLVINATFFAALRLHNTTHDAIDDGLVVQRTLSIVRKDLAGIMIPPAPTVTTNRLAGQLTSEITGTNDLDLTGERVTPDLYTNSGRIDGWTPYADVQMVSYYLSPATDGTPTKNLVRVVARNLLPATDWATEDQLLLTGVSSAAISYFDGANWLDVWDSATSGTLPAAIKFSLVVAPKNGASTRADPAPIELIVPVLVKTTATAQAEAAATTAQ
jgi:prepilin-type N-terminal cleavage/methylation domain-containing protein